MTTLLLRRKDGSETSIELSRRDVGSDKWSTFVLVRQGLWAEYALNGLRYWREVERSKDDVAVFSQGALSSLPNTRQGLA